MVGRDKGSKQLWHNSDACPLLVCKHADRQFLPHLFIAADAQFQRKHRVGGFGRTKQDILLRLYAQLFYLHPAACGDGLKMYLREVYHLTAYLQSDILPVGFIAVFHHATDTGL